MLLEDGAGAVASFPNSAYEAAGARIVDGDEAFGADVVLKVRAPRQAGRATFVSQLPKLFAFSVDGYYKYRNYKGASAAALYGTRAANGVIQITTKSGGRKPGLGISVNSSFTVDNPFQLPRYQNTFGQGQGGEFEFVGRG